MPSNRLGPVVACSVVCGLLSGAYGYFGLERPPIVDVGTLLVPLVATLAWVQTDARNHGMALVHDWGLIAWIGWPVLLPWYSFKTRGRSGWRILLLLFGLILGPFLAYPFGLVARELWGPVSDEEPVVQEVLRLHYWPHRAALPDANRREGLPSPYWETTGAIASVGV
jgi:hypothetical protein